MFYTIDRFEGGFAVLLDDEKRVFSVERAVLGENAEVGLVFLSEDEKSFTFSPEETEKRKNKAINLHKSLFDRARKNIK